MQGLIGDVAASADFSFDMQGRIAYASQTPFILNTTLKDNILFGTPYDKERYEKVLDACCLLQDLEQIGPAGDMTEIGKLKATCDDASLRPIFYIAGDIFLASLSQPKTRTYSLLCLATTTR